MRPDFSEIKTGKEFNQWYWMKDELIAICKLCGLPYQGGKFTLRDRIMYALDHDGALMPTPKKQKPSSKFDWAKASLTLDTTITDNVSFGPNFRNFMKSQVGDKFSCHSDFMDWVKSHAGSTLKDAVEEWVNLENRKKDPAFKRDIAHHNMLCQYVRDFMEDNPGSKLNQALSYWNKKRMLPMTDGFVVYHTSDLQLS